MSTPVAVAFLRRLDKITANCSLLKTLPTTACAICMDDFKCQDELIRLPNCHHIFHRKCILPRFSRNNTCPVCRRVLPPEKPKIYSVPLRSHFLRIRHRLPLSQQSRNAVIRLNFHLRPDNDRSSSSSSTNFDSDHSQPLPSINRPLEMMLRAEGLPELASRACGPFWISADLTSNVPPAGDGQRAGSSVSINLAYN